MVSLTRIDVASLPLGMSLLLVTLLLQKLLLALPSMRFACDAARKRRRFACAAHNTLSNPSVFAVFEIEEGSPPPLASKKSNQMTCLAASASEYRRFLTT